MADLKTTARHELVKYAAGRVMFCPVCKDILDARSTAVCSLPTRGDKQGVVCLDCLTEDRMREIVVQGGEIDTWDWNRSGFQEGVK